MYCPKRQCYFKEGGGRGEGKEKGRERRASGDQRRKKGRRGYQVEGRPKESPQKIGICWAPPFRCNLSIEGNIPEYKPSVNFLK
jgi:hypothetical protein